MAIMSFLQTHVTGGNGAGKRQEDKGGCCTDRHSPEWWLRCTRPLTAELPLSRRQCTEVINVVCDKHVSSTAFARGCWALGL